MEGIYSVVRTILPLEAYQYSFMIRALLAVILLTPALGLLGTMAVNHQMAFFSDGLGHSAMLGIGLGMVLGLRSDLVSMLIFGVIWAVLICVIKQSGAATTDTIISVFSSTSIAGGLLLLSRSDKLSKSLLIGDILAVMPQDLLYLLLLLTGVVILWIVLYNSLLMTSVDPFLARSRGISTRLIECAFVVTVAIAVMISIHWVGMMLINALLILPAAAGRNIARTSRQHALYTVLIALLSGIIGLTVTFYLDASAGASIVLVSAVMYALSLVIRTARK